MAAGIHWLGQSGFKIEGSINVFTDPYQLRQTDKADIILITHSHGDHFSPSDIRKLLTDQTVIITAKGCRFTVDNEVKILKPGESVTVKGVAIEAVPAYNRNHPRSSEGVGYIITIDGIRIYTAGDTDRIPEMVSIKADIALLPVGGTYTMDAAQAAEAAKDISPKLAIPMHYGSVVGSKKDAQRFSDLLKGIIPVIIKTKE
jgi:L-ascorbate metabolism protein UlaG (beta-lactamase superfamily)